MVAYKVEDKEFKEFSDAVNFAKEYGFSVYEAPSGVRRWTPGRINKKAERMYTERKTAYAAYKKSINT